MKIAMVIERFDRSLGGRETSTAQVAAALARRGHEVTIFCRTCSDACDGVRTVPLQARGPGRAGQFLAFARSVRGATAKGEHDVIHTTLPMPCANVYQPRGGLVPAQADASVRKRSGWAALLAAAVEPVKLYRTTLRRAEKRLVRDDRTLCLAVSEMVAREFLNHYGRRQGVRVVYNGVEVPSISDEQRASWREEIRGQIGADRSATVFLTVATNFRLKGVDEAIRAFGRWYKATPDQPRARLVAVGSERHLRRYRRLARRCGVGNQVHFPGRTDDVFGWYAAADACVLLSWYDPCSRVVLEATRWGIPSITTIYNGAAEALADGAGIVVSSPRDTDAVVRAMTALGDPEQRRRCREACLDRADALGVERHVDELLAAYETLAPRKGDAP